MRHTQDPLPSYKKHKTTHWLQSVVLAGLVYIIVIVSALLIYCAWQYYDLHYHTQPNLSQVSAIRYPTAQAMPSQKVMPMSNEPIKTLSEQDIASSTNHDSGTYNNASHDNTAASNTADSTTTDSTVVNVASDTTKTDNATINNKSANNKSANNKSANPTGKIASLPNTPTANLKATTNNQQHTSKPVATDNPAPSINTAKSPSFIEDDDNQNNALREAINHAKKLNEQKIAQALSHINQTPTKQASKNTPSPDKSLDNQSPNHQIPSAEIIATLDITP